MSKEPLNKAQADPRSTPPEYGSDELLGKYRQAIILHRGQRYTLRETRNGKLLLYK
jgi:hemin uptake protein HemP